MQQGYFPTIVQTPRLKQQSLKSSNQCGSKYFSISRSFEKVSASNFGKILKGFILRRRITILEMDSTL